MIASIAAETGGPAKAAVEMARAVAALGHEVQIYTTDRGLKPEAPRPTSAGPVAIHVYPQQFPALLATSWPLARALADAIPKADVVHLHSLYLFHDWATARICRRAGVPYLLRPHGTLDPYIWRRHRARKWLLETLFQNRVLRQAASLHFTAEEEMRLAAPYAQGAPGVVVPLGIDAAEYATLPPPGDLRQRFPEIGARRIVLFLGRLNFKKGLDLLVPAFARAAAVTPDLHLVIAGPDDGVRGTVEQDVARHGLGSHVTFTGMLGPAERLAALADAFAFVLPSYSENFGLAVAEAMAAGVPVLVSDRVNIWREVEAAQAGLIAPPEVAPFAELIAALAGDPDRAAAMGANGRSLVRTRFAWERIARELEGVYRSLAEQSRGPARQ